MSLRDRLEAKAHGEIATGALSAYSSANVDAYRLLDSLPATGAARLGAWCAFVLQTYADNLLLSGASPGWASPETCEEVQALYQFAGGWLVRAREAAASEGYRLDAVVPQPLPAPRAPRTAGVLRAMRKTLETVQARAGADLAARREEPVAGRLSPIMATAQSAIDSSGALSTGSATSELRATIGQTLQGALDRVYQAGQLLAMPELLARPQPEQAPQPAAHDAAAIQLFLPGDPGFDPWCLTDPVARMERRESAPSAAMLEAFWKADPDPAKTLSIQAEIASALELGAVDYLPEENPGMLERIAAHCPWVGVLYAKGSHTICGTPLEHGDRFVFAVGPDEQGFRREIVSISAAAVAAVTPEEPPAASSLWEEMGRGGFRPIR